MEAVVVYESNFGNTRQIAEAISRGIGAESHAVEAEKFNAGHLKPGSLLVVGSPINAWRPLPEVAGWLSALAPGSLAGIRAASFDTRVKSVFHGDAAKKIAKGLEAAGAEQAAEPTWYYVEGKEGPLLDGELERAERWGAELAAQAVREA
ncbi:flavodoxin family protein [Sinomonas sp.]|jgi:flavodoxin|uniref:flavodoxin family protein n=1 Tax=Sinomonas sp. TaxID=1914986 RepID=UPI002FDF24A5